MMMTIFEALELSRERQAWRPDSLTIEFWNDPSCPPFCAECADFHDFGGTCSTLNMWNEEQERDKNSGLAQRDSVSYGR